MIAVIPFRVDGVHQSVRYLQTGLVDLIAAQLTGDGVPRAVEPRVVIDRWRRAGGAEGISVAAALGIAADMNAGAALTGGVVGNATRVVVTAAVRRVPDGRILAEASAEGSPDEIHLLVDRLVAELVARVAGESEPRIYALSSTTLPVLRAYLRGQAAYRGGRFDEAALNYRRALDLDSTFALAALGLASSGVSAAGLGVAGDPHRDAMPPAWALRERLGRGDRAYLEALAGPRFPGRTSVAEHLAAWERAAERLPDRPEVWYELGDMYYHAGALLGLSDARGRARGAFERALQLDSSFSNPLLHLVDLAVMRGDTASVEHLGGLFLARHGESDAAELVRWRLAVVRPTPPSPDSLRGMFSRMGVRGLSKVLAAGQHDVRWLSHARLAAEALALRQGSASERGRGLFELALYEQNRGDAAAAQLRWRQLAQLPNGPIADPDFLARRQVGEALYAGGDARTAAALVGRLDASGGAEAATDRAEFLRQMRNVCVAEQWRLWHGDTASVARSLARLEAPSTLGDPYAPVDERSSCATLLRALRSSLGNQPGAPAALARLDSLTRTGAPAHVDGGVFVNLALARLYLRSGDPARALSAVRRRWDVADHLATYRLEEGRLAARAGDRAGAIAAYQHLLALRAGRVGPDAGVEEARRELDRLRREARPGGARRR